MPKYNVDVVLTAGEADALAVGGKTVAVVDVLRATTVIIEALHGGARAVVPVTEAGDAFRFRESFGGDALLGGERGAVKIEGFDLGNSPLSYTPERVGGKTVVLSTTNGTRAINNASGASEIVIASFLNMSAASDVLAAAGRDATIVCSGREGRFTMEDGLCAGAMVGKLRRRGFALTDMAEAMRRLWESSRGDVRKALEGTAHYEYLMALGFGADVAFCLREDIYDVVPRVGKDGKIKL